jgi:hypothetical protein
MPGFSIAATKLLLDNMEEIGEKYIQFSNVELRNISQNNDNFHLQ